MSLVIYRARSADPGPPRDRRVGLDRLLDNLVEQGRYALRQLEREHSRDGQEVRALLDGGFLRVTADGRLRPTPRTLRAAEERALAELLRRPGAGAAPGRHAEGASAPLAEAGDEGRPHRPGDPLGGVDLSETLRRGLERGAPLRLREDDVVVRHDPASGRCATVVLLDLSGSMAGHGKFAAARRAALALPALLRRRFPGDQLLTVGFATGAEPLEGVALLEARPRDVGLFDPRRGPQRLATEGADVPGHFTNIQAGLRLARRWLGGKANLGRQVLLITDGEPTAHLEGGELVLAYPPTRTTAEHTLREAARCAAAGVAVHVFGLIGEFSAPGLAVLVERLARAGRGSAACCSPRQLGPRFLASSTRSRPA